MLLSDWRHIPSEETWNDQLASGVENAICMDSILVNGRGSVECLPRETIDAYPDPGIEHILQPNNLKLTDKGYDARLSFVTRLTTADVFRHNSLWFQSPTVQLLTSQQFLPRCLTYAHPVMALAR
jgi:hypothetical protein